MKKVILVVTCLMLSQHVTCMRLIDQKLLEAAKKHKFGLVIQYVKNDANVNIRDEKGCTPLMYSIPSFFFFDFFGKTKDNALALYLLNNGASCALKNNRQETPLYYAAFYGNKFLVELLLKKKALSAHKDPKFNRQEASMLLRESCSNKWFDIAKIALENGADIQSLDVDGSNALHNAIPHFLKTNKDNEIALWLLDKGIDYTIKNKKGDTALSLAAYFKNKPLVNVLLKKLSTTKEIPLQQLHILLHNACQAGWLDIAEKLLTMGADINYQDEWGFAPLHHAIPYTFQKQEEKDIVVWLIKNGADTTLKNIRGYTPLDLAKEYKNCVFIELLQ